MNEGEFTNLVWDRYELAQQVWKEVQTITSSLLDGVAAAVAGLQATRDYVAAIEKLGGKVQAKRQGTSHFWVATRTTKNGNEFVVSVAFDVDSHHDDGTLRLYVNTNMNQKLAGLAKAQAFRKNMTDVPGEQSEWEVKAYTGECTPAPKASNRVETTVAAAVELAPKYFVFAARVYEAAITEAKLNAE